MEYRAYVPTNNFQKQNENKTETERKQNRIKLEQNWN